MGGPGTYLGTGEGALFRMISTDLNLGMISTDLKELYEVVLEEGTFASLQIFGFVFFFFLRPRFRVAKLALTYVLRLALHLFFPFPLSSAGTTAVHHQALLVLQI